MFTIEKGIPIPKRPSNRAGTSKYPWAAMEVGDSIFIARGGPGSVRVAVSRAGKRTGRRFATRKVDGGVRIWRIA